MKSLTYESPKIRPFPSKLFLKMLSSLLINIVVAIGDVVPNSIPQSIHSFLTTEWDLSTFKLLPQKNWNQ